MLSAAALFYRPCIAAVECVTYSSHWPMRSLELACIGSPVLCYCGKQASGWYIWGSQRYRQRCESVGGVVGGALNASEGPKVRGEARCQECLSPFH